MQSIQQAKNAAKHLREAVSSVGHKLNVKDSLYAIARQAGFPSWQEYVRTLADELTVADLLTWLNYIQADLGHRDFMIGVIDSQWRLITTLNISGFYVANRERCLYLRANTKSHLYGVISAYEIIRRLPKKTSTYNVAIKTDPEFGTISLRPDSLWKHWSESTDLDNTGYANALLADSVLPAKPWRPQIGYCTRRSPDLPVTIPKETIEPESNIEKALLCAGATFDETLRLHRILMSFPETDRAFYTWAIEDVLRCRRARGDSRTATGYLFDYLKAQSDMPSLTNGCEEWTDLDIPWGDLSFAVKYCYSDDEVTYRTAIDPLLSALAKV